MMAAYRVSHVAVIGLTPPAELDRRLRRILRAGQLTSLPAGIVQVLWERRRQANREGAWVERHYRPGSRCEAASDFPC
jgi:hypothetical protein